MDIDLGSETMENFYFTLLIRGKLRAYSREQVMDSFASYETEELLREAIEPVGFSGGGGVYFDAALILVDKISYCSPFGTQVEKTRDRIAEQLYQDYLLLISDHIHSLGQQITALKSVRAGFFTTSCACQAQVLLLTDKIFDFELRFGYAGPNLSGTWRRFENYRDFENYHFKSLSFQDLDPKEKDVFLGQADEIVGSFSNCYLLPQIEKFMEEKGEILARKKENKRVLGFDP